YPLRLHQSFLIFSCFFTCSLPLRALPSFPTRRSSDLLFLFVGLKYIRPELWTTPSFAPNGLKGISVGAAIIFFSYIGFDADALRSEEHTSELQSRFDLVCRLLLEKKKNI